jgi:phosphoglycolate phosphatase
MLKWYGRGQAMKEYVFMDLDGTLTNPKLGITKSVRYALQSKGVTVEDLESLCKFIGPPLRESFMNYYGFDAMQAEELVSKYREYYKVTGLYENEAYDGMEKLLSDLRASGRKLYVATSKPEEFAVKVLEHFHLAGYFEDICGATMDGRRSTKEEIIRYTMDRNSITEKEKIVMVGDREHDILGAKAVGIASLGVLYGYGSREELQTAGADAIAERVKEVFDIIVRL